MSNPSQGGRVCLAARRIRFSPRNALSALLQQVRGRGADWADIQRYISAVAPAGTTGKCVDQAGKRVLLLGLSPFPYCFKIEGLLGRALRERGFSIVGVANQQTASFARGYYRDAHGFEVVQLEDFASFSCRREIQDIAGEAVARAERDFGYLKSFNYRGVPLGIHSLATLSAMVPDGRLEIGSANRGILKSLMVRSMMLLEASLGMAESLRPVKMLGVEKGTVGTCESFYAALKSNIDYVQWTGCHEPNSIMLKRYHWDNYRDHPFSMSSRSWERICALPWSDQYRDQVMAQFEAGYKEGTWFMYKGLATDQLQRERRDIVERLGLDSRKKTAIIYSHILSDANLFYGDDLFPNGFEEWLIETVRAAASNREINWVLKLHPANIYRHAKLDYSGKYGELLALERAFGRVPEFLRVVYPEEKTSPLSFFKITDYGVTVRGTVGLELPCFGIPALTAGTGRYSGRGFTVDSNTREEYLEKIRSIHHIPRLTIKQIQLGQRYAFFIFRARPAKYGEMLSDVYNFPVNHPRHRDVSFDGRSLSIILEHPQMQKIVSFLQSSEEDFIDLPIT